MGSNRIAEVAWAAGLFEGEGSISFNRKRSTSGVLTYGVLALGMTDESTVQRFQDAVGGGSIYVERRPPYKDMYVWHSNSREVFLRVGDLLKPWLSQRRQDRLEEVRSGTSDVRRRPPQRKLCKRGHWLAGNNAKPNGFAKNGEQKYSCRFCVNAAERQRQATR